MTMKIHTFDGTAERNIVIGMVVDPTVVGRLSSQWQGAKSFSNQWAGIIADMAVGYFRKYGKAPKKNIEPLIRSAEGRYDEATIKLLELFAQSISNQYEQLAEEINPQYILDLCDRHLNGVRLKQLADKIQGDVDSGNVDQAVGRVTSYHKLELGEQSAARVFTDPDEIAAAFRQNETSPFVEYPGALGEFFQDSLAPNSLIAVVAPEKAGKTFMLLDIAYRAASQRKRVVFFETGDMSKQQIEMRFWSRVAQLPLRSPTGQWPCIIPYPMKIQPPHADGEPATVSCEDREFTHGLSEKTAKEACQNFQRNVVKSKREFLFVDAFPNSSINVAGLRTRLDSYDKDNLTPDVVVIDYADILAPPAGKMEIRDQINQTWKELRALSQERHCLIVTATQANAKSYSKERPLGRENFSEDKRKMAHVSGMIGINVTDAEKEIGVMRLNWIVRREADYSSRKVCHVASCLPLASPAILSTW